MDKGFVIAFEGGEGSGKSTALPIFEKQLKERGFKVKTYAEPGGTEYAKELRRIFLERPDLSVKSALHLMNSQRQDNLENIIQPYVEKGYIVLIDRFVASTIVYQGILSNKLGGLQDKVEQLSWVLEHSLTYPHTVFFFDCKPDVSIRRVRARKEADNHFDALDLSHHYVIYDAYKSVLSELEDTETPPKGPYVPGCSMVNVISAEESIACVTEQLAQEANWLAAQHKKSIGVES